MKIQIVSDIHSEHYFHYDYAKFFRPGADILILAGDIGNCSDKGYRNKLYSLMSELVKMYPHVVYVDGNHEYYGAPLQETRSYLKWMNDNIPNFYWLDNDLVEINGQRFLGGAMWFPKPEDPLWIFTKKLFEDFSAIKGNFQDWVFDQNTAFRSFYGLNVKQDDIVITHYLPSDVCVHNKFKGNKGNIFFVSDMEEYFDLGKKPKLWIHGHTHYAHDLVHDGIRIICNPVGYSSENLNSNIADKINRKIITI
jgi:Icc-related predicted phosphoesterase